MAAVVVVGSGVRWESFVIFTLVRRQLRFLLSERCLVSLVHSFIPLTMATVNYGDSDEAPAFSAGAKGLRRCIGPNEALYGQ